MKRHDDKQGAMDTDDLQEHYDFDYGKAKANRFAARVSHENRMVVLDPDVAAIFSTAESVNAALRAMASIFANLPQAKSIPHP